MNTELPKFCKDCVHCHHDASIMNAICLNSIAYDLVSGDEIYELCSTQRSLTANTSPIACGSEAIFFKPKNDQPLFNQPKEILNK